MCEEKTADIFLLQEVSGWKSEFTTKNGFRGFTSSSQQGQKHLAILLAPSVAACAVQGSFKEIGRAISVDDALPSLGVVRLIVAHLSSDNNRISFQN